MSAASSTGNYSVQLMAGLASSGFTPEQWNAAVDSMIGKTQAYVCDNEALGDRFTNIIF
jgi:hypothetical protein